MESSVIEAAVAPPVTGDGARRAAMDAPRHFRPGDTGTYGRPFEDLRVGDTFETRARTVTEADVVQFAALTGDWHPAHSDETWAEENMFGRRVAHGMLIVAYSLGLVPNDAIVALRRITKINFKQPVFLGDTIHVEGKIAGKRPMSPEAGMVTGRWRTKNQDGETIATMELEALWRRAPQD
ncbi:MAG TPA: MaoC/PaaZ C-terminal domain-containing protein [Thermoleophilaceae bacterium]|jgi:acyl dehydratase